MGMTEGVQVSVEGRRKALQLGAQRPRVEFAAKYVKPYS